MNIIQIIQIIHKRFDVDDLLDKNERRGGREGKVIHDAFMDTVGLGTKTSGERGGFIM